MTTTVYAADRTALLIVDPYNDFMSEGGKFYEATKETAEAVGLYDNMRKLIPAIRAARIQVIIVSNGSANESLDTASASVGSADARKEQRTHDNSGEIHG